MSMSRSRKIDKAVDVMFALLFTGLLIVLIACGLGFAGIEPVATYTVIVGGSVMLLSAVVGIFTMWYHVITD